MIKRALGSLLNDEPSDDGKITLHLNVISVIGACLTIEATGIDLGFFFTVLKVIAPTPTVSKTVWPIFIITNERTIKINDEERTNERSSKAGANENWSADRVYCFAGRRPLLVYCCLRRLLKT